MYAIPNASRVYITSFFLLCAAFFLAPSVASANDGYWSTQERRFITQNEVSSRVNNVLSGSVNRPSGSTISSVPSAPSISKNATGGLSSSTNHIIKTMGQPSGFSSTTNYSVGSAKTALKSCIRSPACAGRALGAGAIIYEGIQAWKDVYHLVYDEPTQQVVQRIPDKNYESAGGLITIGGSTEFIVCSNITYRVVEAIACLESQVRPNTEGGVISRGQDVIDSRTINVKLGYRDIPAPWYFGIATLMSPSGFEEVIEYDEIPLYDKDIVDDFIDEGYTPQVSDAPLVLLSGEPESITLSTPASAELPSTTTTKTSSGGQTTTSVTNKTLNYNVINNNTSNPSINSELVETTTTYDTTGNVTDTTTSTTIANGVQPDISSPSPSAPLDLELPAFCSWASIVCEWIGWTKEGIEGEEPDLINLISEFEPDDNQYNSGIGSGSCPAPMSLNLGIINRTVEVSYQPFCDFLDMIRPLVIAGAWLLSAFMYVGVLRRG